MATRRLVLASLMVLAILAGGSWAARADDTASMPQLQTLAPGSVASILGQRVFDSADDEIGRLIDVLVTLDGQPKAGLVDVGGFMGVGARRVAVAWNLLHFSNKDGYVRIVVDLTLDETAAAPEYRGADGSDIVAGHAKAQP